MNTYPDILDEERIDEYLAHICFILCLYSDAIF